MELRYPRARVACLTIDSAQLDIGTAGHLVRVTDGAGQRVTGVIIVQLDDHQAQVGYRGRDPVYPTDGVTSLGPNTHNIDAHTLAYFYLQPFHL